VTDFWGRKEIKSGNRNIRQQRLFRLPWKVVKWKAVWNHLPPTPLVKYAQWVHKAERALKNAPSFGSGFRIFPIIPKLPSLPDLLLPAAVGWKDGNHEPIPKVRISYIFPKSNRCTRGRLYPDAEIFMEVRPKYGDIMDLIIKTPVEVI